MVMNTSEGKPLVGGAVETSASASASAASEAGVVD